MRCSSQEKVNPVLQVASMTGAWYVWSIMTDSYSYCCWLLLIIVIPVDYIVLLIIKFQIIIGVLYESWFLLSNLHHYQHCCSTRHWLTLQQTWWQLQDPGLDDVLYHSCSISVWACHGMSHISMEDSFRQVLGTVVAGFGFDAVAHIHFWSHCLNMFIDLELANLVVSENGPGWYTEDICFFADLGTKKTMIKTLVFFLGKIKAAQKRRALAGDGDEFADGLPWGSTRLYAQVHPRRWDSTQNPWDVVKSWRSEPFAMFQAFQPIQP